MEQEISLAGEVAKKAVEREDVLKGEKSFAMMLLEDAKANSKRWFLCLIITNLLWAFMFAFYVWLPDEVVTEYSVEAQDAGHAIINEKGDVKINGESKEN